jgi:diaminohydroxyphosphoribosylaminopyrimidine deaminase/5-amino-6-(5-phosphoribosylamino)uracil reductase
LFFEGFYFDNMAKQESYMQRVFQLARKGVGSVNPNPLVGAVVVKDNRIIGEGYHAFFGGPHAEVNALKQATESVEGATVYVNLEPCSHHGKTPPCARLLAEKKVGKVVIATRDPNPLVAGNGIRILREAGIEVVEGVLEADALDLNRVFFKYITTGLPYVVMKAAMTLDGKIATRVGDAQWVSNEKSRALVHEFRHEYKGIMVGVNTIIADDPRLNTRREGKINRHPVRIICDSTGRIPMDAAVLKPGSDSPTIIATTSLMPESKKEILTEGGAEVITVPAEQNRVSLPELMKELGKKAIDGILLEGGGTLNFAALQAGIVDEVVFFIAPKIVGGDKAKTPVEGKGINLMHEAIELTDIRTMAIDKDIMYRAKVKK